jgi:hypothetical protein
MPIQSCSSEGKPGFRFGDSGTCYTYTSGDTRSLTSAKRKARSQEVAARATGWTEKSNGTEDLQGEIMKINLPYDNAVLVKGQHDSMKSWHETMSKSHLDAASWHGQQSEALSKAINEVPLDPSKVVIPVGKSIDSSTNDTDSFTLNRESTSSNKVQKSDLVQLLVDHANEHGNFGESVEQIVDKIFGE